MHQIVVGLNRTVAGQPALIARPQRLHQPPGGIVATADIAHFALPHQAIQRLQRLVDWGFCVIRMCLVQVDGIALQAAQRGVTGVDNMLAAQPLIVRPRPHLSANFGGDDHLAPVAPGLNPATDHLFADAAVIAFHPTAVYVCGVDEVPAHFGEGVHHRETRLLVGCPAELHRPQAKR